ncbi:hypothetical protein TorRG33x02_303320 [Trema orientale]|uniref:Transmembrane protein n=1 Tax=Trema orientale TaxID=63057 RepID=A0A2P5BZK2_TREOI|nr:hypothetical protein TorRG33x02_303320 [Trema orientale]
MESKIPYPHPHPLKHLGFSRDTPTHKLHLKQWKKNSYSAKSLLKKPKIDFVRNEITMLYVFFFLFHSVSLILLFDAYSPL